MFNNKMNILKALGMLSVISGHSGINFLPWFPAYSFHMPLFMFISGYFFHPIPLVKFIKGKTRRLILPFLLWNLIFGMICVMLHRINMIAFGESLSFNSLFLEPFIGGHQFGFNCPTWFIGTLLEVQIIYWLIHRFCNGNMMILSLLALGSYFTSLFMAFNNIYPTHGPFMLIMEKVCFCLFFFHLGLFYKLYGERYDYFSVLKIFALVCFNGFLISFIFYDISFTVAWMTFPAKHFLLPVASSCSGILLYLQVADLLKDKIKRNSLLGFIGENTFSIMTIHLSFFWLLNTLFLYLKLHGIFPLRSFNYERYMHDIFFRVNEHAPMNDMFYFLSGLIGSCICIYIWDKYKSKIFRTISLIKK